MVTINHIWKFIHSNFAFNLFVRYTASVKIAFVFKGFTFFFHSGDPWKSTPSGTSKCRLGDIEKETKMILKFSVLSVHPPHGFGGRVYSALLRHSATRRRVVKKLLFSGVAGLDTV
jgi:hypothetical protein